MSLASDIPAAVVEEFLFPFFASFLTSCWTFSISRSLIATFFLIGPTINTLSYIKVLKPIIPLSSPPPMLNFYSDRCVFLIVCLCVGFT
ncbi:hypothetical protein CROQUDRAFT_518383 [Cronartium quercuum f. sp. fusiforme G11]|uniref:Uncharacterized protein n=1 Tax=Cronartium quercuum f. sp. fusiforme G11 TaxID=708437 RepID=A0A9P6NLS8_9BASI|nr:hypothetical protein CROQUDRAFT_518383 [Cronartium quercuum f. sp. fusiforme G11]